MIEAGVLQQPAVSAMIGLHVDPAFETGSIVLRRGVMNAAVNDFTMEIKGKQCHGAQPERGIDPIVVAADMIMTLQTIATRFTAATNPVVVSIGSIQGGTGCNIIPGEVIMQGTLRAVSNETLDSIKNRVEQIAAGTTATYGASAQFEWMETPFPPLINDDGVIDIVEKAADDIGFAVHHMPETSMGADDFAFFTEAVPGAYFNLGCAPKGATLSPLHNGNFIGDEKALCAGMEIELQTVLALMEKNSKRI